MRRATAHIGQGPIWDHVQQVIQQAQAAAQADGAEAEASI
jgi:hypothetical protein